MGLTPRPERKVVEYNPSSQEGWVATRLDFLVNWGRANSLWPMPFGTACCAIEFMATAASRFDLARFGMERMSFSPRQADVLICAGRVPFKLAPVIRRIWQQMPQPKWSIAMGACASTGNIFDIETVFMIPWGVFYRQLSCSVPLVEITKVCPAGKLSFFGLGEMLVFMLILLVGFIYVWKKGALQWD